jgi:RNA polymerase sigma-70 factor (ECF subfamily)
VPGGQAPEEGAADREEVERLRRAVDELDDEKRLAVLLRYFEGMSLAEMAEVTGTPANTLKVRLFRARRELFEKLDR